MAKQSKQLVVFDWPTLRLIKTDDPQLAPVQPVLFDRYGHIIDYASCWLFYLRRVGKSLETVHDYGRVYSDFAGVLAASNGGKGIDYSRVTESFLERWKYHLILPARDEHGRQTGNRGIQSSSFNAYLSVVLNCFLYAQKWGWCSGLIGENSSEVSREYRISVSFDEKGYIKHALHEDRVEKPTITLPTNPEFDLVFDKRVASAFHPEIGARDGHANETMRTYGLRRSETARMKCSSVPTKSELEGMRRKYLKNGALALTLQLWVEGSKKSGWRQVSFDFNFVEKLRDFIDNVRPFFVKPGKDFDEIFLSSTGEPLRPQYFTNSIKLAARAVSQEGLHDRDEFDIATLRPHFGRHRALTDTAIRLIRHGHTLEEALLILMELSGIRTLEVLWGYIHTAQAAIRAAEGKTGAANGERSQDVEKRLINLSISLSGNRTRGGRRG